MASALIVEDEPIMALHIEMLLAGHGIDRCHVARTVAHARTIALGLPLVLAIVEKSIGGHSTESLIPLLQAQAIPVVLLVDAVAAAAGMRGPGVALMERSITAESLAATLTRLGIVQPD